MKRIKKLLTVDIGYNTGFAYWTDSSPENVKTGVIIEAKKDKEMKKIDRLYKMSIQFRNVIAFYKPKRVVFESVNLWGGSDKSQTSASQGYLFDLSSLLGMYTLIAKNYKCDVHWVSVQEWKGTLSKEATRYWIEKLTNKKYSSEHINDAIGIGLYLQGIF